MDDVAFACAGVETVSQTHSVDTRAVIGIGYSNGGQMIFRLLHETPELLAGAVVIAATMPDRAGFLGEFSESGSPLRLQSRCCPNGPEVDTARE